MYKINKCIQKDFVQIMVKFEWPLHTKHDNYDDKGIVFKNVHICDKCDRNIGTILLKITFRKIFFPVNGQ